MQIQGPETPIELGMNHSTFEILPHLLKQYGPMVRIPSKARGVAQFLINEPEWIRHVLQKNYINYKKGPGFASTKLLMRHGIIATDGEEWRKQRKLMQPCFKDTVIESFFKTMLKCNKEVMNDWSRKISEGAPINVTHDMNALAIEIMVQTIFAADLEGAYGKLGGNPFGLLAQDRSRDLLLVRKFESLRKVLHEIVEDRRKKPVKGWDLLRMLMQPHENGTPGFEGDDLIDQIVTLVIAGHETTGSTLNWMWYLLSIHPEAQDKIYAEVSKIKDISKLTAADLHQISYLGKVYNEALRLYPPVWMYSRTAIEDDHFGDTLIPAGSHIYIAPYYLHRDARFWIEPELFNPERFSAGYAETKLNYEFIPFSEGPRRCIGDEFATLESYLHFILFLAKFKVLKTSKIHTEYDIGLNLRSQDDIVLPFELR